MCCRFQLTAPAPVLEEQFDVMFEKFPPRRNISPSQPVTIVRMNPNVFRKKETALVLWGLIPSYIKNLQDHQLLYNARGEGIWERPSFRHAMARRRCLIPATAFYEWEHVGGAKIPYAFSVDGQNCFGMGGIWETWSGPNGEEIESCCIITIPANKTVGRIHSRMPLIIHPDDYLAWLNPDLYFEDELRPYMRPVPSEMLKSEKAPNMQDPMQFNTPTLFEPEDLL